MTGVGLLLIAIVALTTDPVHDAIEAGNAAMQAQQYDEALSAYGAAAQMAPDSAAAHLNLAAALYASGHPEEALGLYQRLGADETLPHALQAKLNGSAAAIAAGDLHRQQGDEEGARRLYQEGLDLATSYLGYRSDDDRGAKNAALARKRLDEEPPPPEEQDQNKDQQDQDQQNEKKEEQSESSQGEGDQQKEDERNSPPPDEGEKNDPSDRNDDQPKPGEGENQKPDGGDDQQKEQPPASEQNADPGDLTEQQASSILRAVEADEQALREKLRQDRAKQYDTPPPGGKDW